MLHCDAKCVIMYLLSNGRGLSEPERIKPLTE
jgi:hypothetical protein